VDAGRVETVHGDPLGQEMGAITEILYREKAEKSPALLFDRIKGYPEGYRCLYGMSLAEGSRCPWDFPSRRTGLMNLLRRTDKMEGDDASPPRVVNDGRY